MQFRKKPIVIEALQFFPDQPWPEGVARRIRADGGWDERCDGWWIETLEGGHVVSPGDWIVTGIKGERYPCKPDIFEATYERAEVLDGAGRIACERVRQKQKWRDVHDDEHDRADLAIVAAQIAVHETDASVECPADLWEGLDDHSDPWGLIAKHRYDRVRQLTIAGALIAAEIDRLQRAQPPTGEPDNGECTSNTSSSGSPESKPSP
jgi:hypothetical protein